MTTEAIIYDGVTVCPACGTLEVKVSDGHFTTHIDARNGGECFWSGTHVHNKPALPYEDAAELRTGLSGWVCKKCSRYWADDEHMARRCCSDNQKCGTPECAHRVRRSGLAHCDPCNEKRDNEAWKAFPEVEWDGETPLCLHGDDRYFFDPSDIKDYAEENETTIADLRLVLCERDPKPQFDMHDFVCDYLPSEENGGEHEFDSSAIEKKVNKWIAENIQDCWMPTKARPSAKSLKTGTTFKKPSTKGKK